MSDEDKKDLDVDINEDAGNDVTSHLRKRVDP